MESQNMHSMITRSKSKYKPEEIIDIHIDQFDDIDDIDDIDENDELDIHGNLKDFIIYDGDTYDKNTKKELNKELKLLRSSSFSSLNNESTPKKGKRYKKDKKKNQLNSIFLSYIIQRATEKANQEIKKKRKTQKKKVESESDNEEDIDLTDVESDLESELESDLEITDEENEADSEEEEEEEEEEAFEYDEYDEKYEELMVDQSNMITEDVDMEYFHKQSIEQKEKLISDTKMIYQMNDSNIPLRFKILNSEMKIETKAIAIENIDKMAEMDVSTGEYSKMHHWINGLIKIPFGKYKQLSITTESSIDQKREFIQDTYHKLNNAIYGHNEAKTHILQVLGKWIKNPDSGGNVLAIQGPMGNGKTTLVKEGIAKALNRPFAFIALGGASDSAYFDGHCYTYEGSHWGRIVQILQDSKCMNPIIYFDELDKISHTHRGEEIVHLLTHLTDSSQNSMFQDNYFPGVHLDLSKVLFIFSYNDETNVDKILKDRMYVIHTKGFQVDDKMKIANKYLIPDIFETFGFKESDIIFQEDILKNIIQNYTGNEEGVRNLKRCIETIVSKINIYLLSYDKENQESTKDLSFQIKDFQIPLTINNDHIIELLKKKNTDAPPPHMYL